MPTYVIGDVQGCFATLQRLLARVRFDPQHDTIWLVGDIVNRGPASAEVLQWAYQWRAQVSMVLGNHDLRLLSLAHGFGTSRSGDTLDALLHMPQLREALVWLRQQPVFACPEDRAGHAGNGIAMVHAGLHPSWSIDDALALNREVQHSLAGDDPKPLLHAWTNDPAPQWNPTLAGTPRLCSILRVMTTARICKPDGEVLWRFTQPPDAAPPGFMPWFAAPARRSQSTTIACGHWAALGLYTQHNVRALDTGCVWGKALTAWRIDDDTYVSEASVDGAAAGD